MKKKSCWLLFSFLILYSFVTGTGSQDMVGRSTHGEPEAALGPTGMPGLGGWSGSQPEVIVTDEQNDFLPEEEDIELGDTGEPGLGGLTGAEPLEPIPVSDEGIPEGSEPLGDTGKPGLGGISGSTPGI